MDSIQADDQIDIGDSDSAIGEVSEETSVIRTFEVFEIYLYR
jgi:hypothetical protein